MIDSHSVSAGLDYPGVGPEHSFWKDSGRVRYTTCRDADAMSAFDTLARLEGILPALESSHAVAAAMDEAARRATDEVVIVCLSGRGDKDAAEVARGIRQSDISAIRQHVKVAQTWLDKLSDELPPAGGKWS